ncbi:MAG: hypothetical protein IJ249_02080 [Paludibacteraceae bacterium]|nr:hypothetical protein [Paludibacteraceae bacterium]
MKKRFIAIILPLLASMCVSAQTYKNGTWYSYYSDDTHTMNTQGDYEHGGVFAPTAGKLNVKWKYEWVDWLGFARKIDTEVFESANNGSSTNKVGSFQEKTGNGSDVTEAFNISTNINWIKYNRSGLPTHKVHVYHEDIPLAKHILLASGDYGTKAASHDFGELEIFAVSDAYTVNLRSFLTNGDITVTSSDPENFRVGNADSKEPVVYAVGANACASANGSAAAAGGGTLGKISNYNFPIYFVPQKGGSFEATITITDGTSTATVKVSGTAPKHDQTITWEPELTLLSNATIASATASSELDVTYSFEPAGVVALVDGVLTPLTDGRVTITASQPGNDFYNPAEPVVKTFTIHPAVTYYEYSAAICEGETYSDDVFNELTASDTYTYKTANVYGGDSLISLVLTVNPVYRFVEEKQIYLGAQDIWQGQDLSLLPLGDTTMVAEYTSGSGCDSTYTLHLHVLVPPTTYGTYEAAICQGDSVEYEGKWYFGEAQEEVTLAQKNLLGGDSIVRLTVTVYPVYAFDEYLEIYAGADTTWQGHDLSEIFPVADSTIIAEYKSLNDCDSTYMLHLTVLAPTRHGVYDAAICEGDSVEYEGKWYYGATQEEVTLAQKNYYGGDSIVTLTVAVHPVYAFNEEMTMYAGADSVWQKKNLSELTVGDTTIVAEYKTIHGCDSTYTLLLHVQTPPTHYGELNVSLCSGEKFVYEGKTYKKTTTATVVLAQKNMYGGDSIVELTVNVYPKMLMESSMTIIMGTDTTWENIDLSVLPVGDTTLVAAYKNIQGCDSTFTLHLTVEPIPTAYGEYEAAFCEGDSVEYAGTWYYEATETEILLKENSTLGGDSIVRLTVTVHPVESTEETRQIMLGTQEIWNEIDFSALPLGDTTLVVKGTTEYGCDSTHTLYLTVVENTATAIDQTQADLQPAAAKELRNGLIYIRKGDNLYDVCGRKVEAVRL